MFSVSKFSSGLPGEGERQPTMGARKGYRMLRRLTITLALVVLAALMIVPAALAQTMPDLTDEVGSYGSALVSALTSGAADVLPYAAVFTGIGIAFAFIKGWIGRRKATSVAR